MGVRHGALSPRRLQGAHVETGEGLAIGIECCVVVRDELRCPPDEIVSLSSQRSPNVAPRNLTRRDLGILFDLACAQKG